MRILVVHLPAFQFRHCQCPVAVVRYIHTLATRNRCLFVGDSFLANLMRLITDLHKSLQLHTDLPNPIIRYRSK